MNKTTFSAHSELDERMFFLIKDKIDAICWELHIQWCMFSLTGCFFSSSFPKGQVKPSTWDNSDIVYCELNTNKQACSALPSTCSGVPWE